MGLSLKSIGATLASPFSGLSEIAGGTKTGQAMLTGIPFIGEGFAQQQQQDFNSAQSLQQMSFQERMSSTAHQRQVEDMRKAGLNPILSATGGSGASSPSGAMASSGIASGASSSAQMAKSLFNQERSLNQASTEKLKQDTATSKSTEAVNKQDEVNMKKQAQILASTAKKAEADAKVTEATAKNEEEFQKKYGYLERITNAVGNFFGQFMGSARSVVDMKDKLNRMNTEELTEKYSTPGKSGQLKRRVPKLK